MNEDVEALEESGGIEDVIRALGNLLDHALGHQQAMDVLTARFRSGEHVTAAATAELVAEAIGYDGQQAIDAMKMADERAKFYGTIADGFKPPEDTV